MLSFFASIFIFFTLFKFADSAREIEVANVHQTEPHQNGEKLNILMMMPAFNFNRSHMNFALAIFLVLQKQAEFHVDFVVPYFIKEDIKFLENDGNLKNILKFYELKNDKTVKKIVIKNEEKEEEKEIEMSKDEKLQNKIIFYELKNGQKIVKKTEKEEQKEIEMGKKSLADKLKKLKKKIEKLKKGEGIFNRACRFVENLGEKVKKICNGEIFRKKMETIHETLKNPPSAHKNEGSTKSHIQKGTEGSPEGHGHKKVEGTSKDHTQKEGEGTLKSHTQKEGEGTSGGHGQKEGEGTLKSHTQKEGEGTSGGHGQKEGEGTLKSHTQKEGEGTSEGYGQKIGEIVEVDNDEEQPLLSDTNAVVLSAEKMETDSVDKTKADVGDKTKGKEKISKKTKEEEKDPIRLEDILKQDGFGKRMDYFPDIWIDMIEKESKYLKGKKYDLAITEISHPSQYALAFFEWLGIKKIIVTKNYSPNAQQYADLGLMNAFFNANLPIVGKVDIGDHQNCQLETQQEKFNIDFALQLEGTNEELKKYDKKFAKYAKHLPHFAKDGRPSVRNYFRLASYFLVNTQPELEFDEGKILMSAGDGKKVKMIGGIHLDEKEFDEEEQKEEEINKDDIIEEESGIEAENKLDPNPKTAKLIEEKYGKIKDCKGIVLISFGSVVDTVKNKFEIFVQLDTIQAVIKEMQNYFFIWHLSKNDPQIEEMNKKEANVYAAEWLDLKAILADSRTKAFMSHCGKNSLFESIYFGVPVVCVPIFSDQFYNAETVAKQQLAVVLDFYCIEMEIDVGKSKTTKMLTLKHIKASGNTQLEKFDEDFFLLPKEEQNREFLEINEEKNYTKNKKGEIRMSAKDGKYDYCFTKKNIENHLMVAINAQENKKHENNSRISWTKLQEAKDKFHKLKPHQVVIETVKEIRQQIKEEIGEEKKKIEHEIHSLI